jgi:hypothetical protein
MTVAVDLWPDAELLLITYFGQLGDPLGSYSYCTKLPAQVETATGPVVFSTPVVRVTRTSGTGRSIRVERPIMDIDVYSDDLEVSQLAARLVSQAIRNMRAVAVSDADSNRLGSVQHVDQIIGCRWLPDVNPHIFRVGASYEVHCHR